MLLPLLHVCYTTNATKPPNQVSTFSWWAAFLSEATEIHFPLAGMLHPKGGKRYYGTQIQGDLTVFDEDRYIYHDLLTRQWWGKYDTCSNAFEYQFSSI